jgi:hypothetical protein
MYPMLTVQCYLSNATQCYPMLPNDNYPMQTIQCYTMQLYNATIQCNYTMQHRLFNTEDLSKSLWQLGKTQVFMRDSVYEAMLQWQKGIVALTLQRWWRGSIVMYKYRRGKRAVQVLQKGWRYLRIKKQFMKYSSVILIIQRYTRGHFGRQLARARRAVVRRDRACLLLQRLQRGRVARVATALLVSVFDAAACGGGTCGDHFWDLF